MEKDTLQELKNWQSNENIIRSYGRIKSRKLSDHKKFLLDNKLQKYQVTRFNNSIKHCVLEIGFGFGDFIFEKAKKNPDISFFGCEPHINGIVNLLSKLENNSLSNIKIINNDLRLVIENIPDDFFEEIYILFPDPWPKSKHFKRRLINHNFLDNVLSRILKTKGKIIIATDHDSYKTWILSHILRSKKFKWLANSKNSWQTFPNDWVETKYQKKAYLEGRKPILIEIVKQHA